MHSVDIFFYFIELSNKSKMMSTNSSWIITVAFDYLSFPVSVVVSGRLKTRDWKTRDWKTREHNLYGQRDVT